jgi:uncharacterized protein
MASGRTSSLPGSTQVKSEWIDGLRRGDFPELQRLLAAGMNINARDEHGQTGLMQAARHGRLDIVEFLIRQGAALDYTAKFGLSALMLAVVNGHADVARVLTQAGARQDLRGTGAPGFDGKTASDLAKASGDADLVAALGM